MQLKPDFFKTIFRYRIAYHVLGIYFFVLLLLSVAGYGGYVIYGSWDRLSLLNSDVERYKSSVEFISKNRSLVAKDVDLYNSTLEELIPDEESYFAVVTALERLAVKTGVTIKSYTIDLESTNVSKLSLRVEIVATQEALEKLLADYKYAGGRLITIEKADLSSTGESVNVFLFNFYHGPYTVGSSISQEQLTPKDVERIHNIQSQM